MLALGFASNIGNVVEIAIGIRRLVVDRWRQDLISQRHQANNQFRCASGGDQVPHHAFSAGNGSTFGVLTKRVLNRLCFYLVVYFRAGAVCIDVINLVFVQSSVFNSK